MDIMNYTQAIQLAQDVLIWWGNDPEMLQGFLAQSGLAVADLRTRAESPDLAEAILAYLMTRDDWLVDAAEALSQSPESFRRAYLSLSGPSGEW